MMAISRSVLNSAVSVDQSRKLPILLRKMNPRRLDQFMIAFKYRRMTSTSCDTRGTGLALPLLEICDLQDVPSCSHQEYANVS